MRPTTRFWTVAATGATLAVLAAAFARPLLLYGAAGVGAWLLVAAVDAVSTVADADERLTVDYAASRDAVTVDRPVDLRLAVAVDGPLAVPVAVEAAVPVGADAPAGAPSLRLSPGESSAAAEVPVTVPVAGRFRLPAPTVAFVGPRGLFAASAARGPAPTVVAEAPRPTTVHVGRGGERYATAFGTHRAGGTGSGTVPSGLREYTVDDPADRIDWNVTARLDDPYVREFDPESSRRTVLVVDHRDRTGVGPPGGTALDYLRTVADGVHGAAVRDNDPVGLYAVGDEGLTARHPPASTPRGYGAVRRALDDLTPTDRPRVRPEGVSPDRSTALAARLAGDGSAFATRLRPYVEATDRYVERFVGDPLFATVRTAVADTGGTTWVALFTDDGDRPAVRAAVRAATRAGDHALVFLAPRVLYDPGGLADLDGAYDAYRSFERFRRDLDALPRVAALEVAPGDRLDALLAARRRADDANTTV